MISYNRQSARMSKSGDDGLAQDAL